MESSDNPAGIGKFGELVTWPEPEPATCKQLQHQGVCHKYFIRAHMKNDGHSLHYAAEACRSHQAVVLEAAKQTPRLYLNPI